MATSGGCRINTMRPSGPHRLDGCQDVVYGHAAVKLAAWHVVIEHLRV